MTDTGFDSSINLYVSLFSWIHFWLFAFLLFAKKNANPANKYLALFIFCFSFIHIQHILVQTGFIYYFPFFDPICGIVLCAIGPLFYFYVRSLLGYKLRYNDFLHFLICLPAIINLVLLLLTKSAEQLSGYYYTSVNNENQYTNINTLLLVGMISIFVGYQILSLRAIISYTKNTSVTVPKQNLVYLQWLKNLLWILVIISCVLSPMILILGKVKYSFVLDYLSTGIYFYIIIKVLSASTIFTPIAVVQKDKYEKSNLSFDKIAMQGAIVADFIANNPMIFDEELSLEKMAFNLNMSIHQLSETINRYFSKNFADLINDKRIERAKQELLQLDNLNITIEGIGYKCGFGSKAAFYRAFKKSTGVTPTVFLKTQITDL